MLIFYAKHLQLTLYLIRIDFSRAVMPLSLKLNNVEPKIRLNSNMESVL